MPLRLLVAGLEFDCKFEVPGLEDCFRRAWEPAHRLAQLGPPAAAEGGPPVHYLIDAAGRLYRNDVLLSDRPYVIDRLGEIETDILSSVIRSWSKAVLIHGGCVEFAGRVFFLLGPSGAGKSTMTRKLLRRGGSYLTDDLVVMTHDALYGVGRTVQFDALMEGESLPSHLQDCRLDGYPIVDRNDRARFVPLWHAEHPVVARLSVDPARTVVCDLRRGDSDDVTPLDSLRQLSAIHAASLTSGASYSEQLRGAVGLSVEWRDPEVALDRIVQSLPSVTVGQLDATKRA